MTLYVPLEEPRLCRNRPATGRSVGRRTIGLASSGLGRVWPVGISLSHRAPVTPVAVRAQCMPTKVARCTVFYPVRLASWVDAVLKKQGGLVGLCFGGPTALDLHLSPARTGVAAIRQDCNYQLDTMKLRRIK